MPLNVRRFCTFVFLVFSFSIVAFAQTSADVMRERVAKAKAYIAVKNYNAAIYELENIRRETKEPAVNSVVNVLLMNSYLEQSDYKRAQEFLKELQNDKTSSASTNYFAAASQVVKEARSQLDRYKALGLSVSDRNLPLEAINDVEKMRETLEMVVEQSKVIGKDKAKTSEAMALLEEATNARGGLARDDFDANRWKNEISDAREQLANSNSVVVNAVDGTTSAASNNVVAQNTAAINNQQISTLNAAALPAKPIEANIISPVSNPSPGNLKTANNVSNSVVNNNSKSSTSAEPNAKNESSNQSQVETPKLETKKSEEVAKTSPNTTSTQANNTRVEETQKSENKTNPSQSVSPTTSNASTVAEQKTDNPINVGSLIEYVTQKVAPVYPPAARTVRMSGVVKVDIVVDEEGKVAEVQSTTGPQMLQRAATDAVKRWKFKPFVRDGQPTKAAGFVSFNFSL